MLWVLDGGYERVVDAAVDCLVSGLDSDAVAMLAGSLTADPFSERLALVDAALEELGLAPLPVDPDALAAAGAAVIAGALARGERAPEDVGSWVTGSLTCETRGRMEQALASGAPAPLPPETG